MKFIRPVAWAATIMTYVLIMLGGTVLATNSGLSCPDWPFCNGQAYFAGTGAFFVQFHRFTTVALSILIVLLVTGIIAWARKDRTLLTLAIAAPVLLTIQIVLGALTVLWKLPQQIITAHLGTAMAIFAVVITIAILSSKPQTSRELPARTRKFAQLAVSNAVLVYILMLFGSYVTGSGAAMACPGWPFCTPASWAVSNHLANINILHRVYAVFVGLVMLWTVIAALRRRHVAPGQAIVAVVGGVLFVCQAIAGGLLVLLNDPAFVAGFHLALSTAVWGTLVLLAALAANQLRAAPAQQEIEKMELAEAEKKKEVSLVRQTISNYVDLMKPHVTVLLLGVTAAAMSIANQGLPPLSLLIPTLLGGAMAAGSANCINCYIDRDIDQVMGRTQRRSLPSGRVEPRQALVFGIILAMASFVLLYVFVNLLSAVLAFSAILFYVFIYTLWLKRTTTQNIVIGGAAGAVPVLVGWAAITNSLSLPAIWLFAIIFFWTPPHFWALSLLIQKDYEKAKIPMLPVVKGEAETRRQILLYSVLLLAITLALFVMGTMGYLYLVGALLLGGGLVYLAIRLWHEKSKKWAKTLFWYSNMYLAALFAIMVIDRVVH
ncbi:MAG TPA: heme o synthase [Ktedonobacteraceae bacterium]|nr:heme o synthase [Ktedonobacteraceae bacterium]